MDRMVYDHIISEIQSNIDLESYYNEIHKAKTDIERNLSLGVKLLMEKDRKNFIVHKCVNPKCPYYLNNLKKLIKSILPSLMVKHITSSIISTVNLQ